MTIKVPPPPVLPGGWTFWADQAAPPHTPYGPMTLAGFTCSQPLSDFGAGEAVIPVDDNPMERADLLQFWCWRLWAFYDGQLMFGGLPTGLQDIGGTTVTVSLAELPGYLAKRVYATRTTYTQVEQVSIAADLAARLDGVGVSVVTDPGPGKLRDRTYNYLDGPSRADLLTALAQVNNGPQFRAEYSADLVTGLPACTLKIAYPRVGVAGTASGLALVVPDGAVSFQATWTSDQERNRTFAVGDLTDGAPVGAKRPVVTDFRPQAGVPTLDAADDFPGVILVSTLTERAATNATIYAGPALALTAVMPVSSPPLGTYGVGDDVGVVLADPLIPGGLATTGQIIQIATDAGAGTATWTVSITMPHQRMTDRLAARLRIAEARLANMFRSNLADPPTGIET